MEETNHLLRTYLATQNIAISEKIEDSKVYANSNNIKKKIIENALEDNDHIIQLTKQQWEYYSDSDKYQMLYNNLLTKKKKLCTLLIKSEVIPLKCLS